MEPRLYRPTWLSHGSRRAAEIVGRLVLSDALPLSWLKSGWCKLEARLTKRRRSVAIVSSLFLHALVFALLLMGVTGNISGGGSGGTSSGFGSGSGFGVELISIRYLLKNDLTVKQPTPEEETALDQPETVEMKPSASDLSIVATADTRTLPDLVVTAGSPEGSATEVTGSEAAAGAAGIVGQTSGINDPLWKQIEPCWHRLADGKLREATLRIDFSPLGNVVRTLALDISGPSDSKALRTAIDAVAQCGPYLVASSREKVVISFPEHH